MVNTVCSAISKYHIVDKDTDLPIGQHSLVSIAKKAFWQQGPPLPKHCGNYDVRIILKLIEKFGANKVLSLR